MSTATVKTISDRRTLFGHPLGLYILFLTEMWERFSYYGMRVLLTLYMTNYLIDRADKGQYVWGFESVRGMFEHIFGHMATQPLASQLYGLYTGLVYMTPLFGGILADRLIGQRRTVVIGGILMAIGHFLMAVESLFFLALLFLILGNGCFKPNISTQVGGLYKDGDPRRDGAFTIFYMGINLGALFSPFVCGTLGQLWGWHWGFGAAGVGMVIGLMIYLFGQRFLAEDQHGLVVEKKIEHKPLTTNQKKAIGALLVLIVLNIFFWAVYEQQGNTLQLFADKRTDWHIFGWEQPSSWFQAYNPAFIILLAPILNALWTWQARRGGGIGSVMKMGVGAILVGLSFLLLVIPSSGLADDQKVSFLWLVLSMFVVTVGELYLSPIGLSLVSKTAPPKYVSMMMGLWMMSNFLGNILSGNLGMLYSSLTLGTFFLVCAGLAIATGLAIMAFNNPLKKAIGSTSL